MHHGETGHNPALPENPAAYFLPDEDAQLLPLDSLEAIRRRPEGVRNAARLMLAASKGEVPRREPLRVEPIVPGRWRILDGNSTFAVAKLSRWKSIPCVIRKSSPGEGP